MSCSARVIHQVAWPSNKPLHENHLSSLQIQIQSIKCPQMPCISPQLLTTNTSMPTFIMTVFGSDDFRHGNRTYEVP